MLVNQAQSLRDGCHSLVAHLGEIDVLTLG